MWEHSRHVGWYWKAGCLPYFPYNFWGKKDSSVMPCLTLCAPVPLSLLVRRRGLWNQDRVRVHAFFYSVGSLQRTSSNPTVVGRRQLVPPGELPFSPPVLWVPCGPQLSLAVPHSYTHSYRESGAASLGLHLRSGIRGGVLPSSVCFAFIKIAGNSTSSLFGKKSRYGKKE